MGFELRPRLGGREGLVPSSDVIGENCRTRDDNEPDVDELLGRFGGAGGFSHMSVVSDGGE